MQINDPATVAELHQLYSLYEAALVNNDVETLTAMFWASPHAIRLGAGENLYGVDEIEAFRKSRPSANLSRRVGPLEVVTFQRLRQHHAGVRT